MSLTGRAPGLAASVTWSWLLGLNNWFRMDWMDGPRVSTRNVGVHIISTSACHSSCFSSTVGGRGEECKSILFIYFWLTCVKISVAWWLDVCRNKECVCKHRTSCLSFLSLSSLVYLGPFFFFKPFPTPVFLFLHVKCPLSPRSLPLSLAPFISLLTFLLVSSTFSLRLSLSRLLSPYFPLPLMFCLLSIQFSFASLCFIG